LHTLRSDGPGKQHAATGFASTRLLGAMWRGALVLADDVKFGSAAAISFSPDETIFPGVKAMSSLRVFGLLLLMILISAATFAQERAATGGIKGKVRGASGATVSGVSVIARRGEQEVARATTGSKGEFVLSGLMPGVYGLTFRKPGLRAGTLEGIEVRAGKTRELSDRLILQIDEGTLAFIRGSVFSAGGRSVPGARVEIARVEPDGTTKKIDGRITNETGSFVFRLMPDAATYRVTVKADKVEPISKDVEVDGAAVYRIALSLPPVQR
jgi:hypothetical protein